MHGRANQLGMARARADGPAVCLALVSPSSPGTGHCVVHLEKGREVMWPPVHDQQRPSVHFIDPDVDRRKAHNVRLQEASGRARTLPQAQDFATAQLLQRGVARVAGVRPREL